MKLLKLKAHNVFSIGDIELNLKNRGLTLVTGWSYDDNNGNAAGKSSVARNSIIWGLYGKTVDGVRADSVINTSIKNAKHCGATIHFEGVDGDTYRIYRARKPNSLSLAKFVSEEPEEWEDLSKRLEKDTQELIDKLLGRDHKTFIQSDFFGQGRERSFLELPGSEQRAVIEEILPLSSLDTWHNNASDARKKAQDKLNKSTAYIRVLTERVQMASNHMYTMRDHSTSWDTNRTVDLSQLQHTLNKLSIVSSDVDKEIAELMMSLPTDKDVIDLIDNYSSKDREYSLEHSSLSYKIDTLTAVIDARSARPNICRECSQSLPQESIDLNQEAIRSDTQKREALINKRGEIEAQLYQNSAQLAICNEVRALESRVKTREEESRIKESIKLLKEAVNPFTDLLTTAKETLHLEQKALDLLSKEVEGLEKTRDHFLFWERAFGGDIKTMLFDQVCPYLEDKSNQYLRDLNNGQIKVKFSIIKEMKSGDTKDQFSVTAGSDTGSSSFDLFSGAEKQLTSFAVGMALSDLAGLQTQGQSKFIILDEPFLYQSPQNCENIVNFITTHKVESGSTILIISNEDNLVNLIPNRVHVVKRNGVSTIE